MNYAKILNNTSDPTEKVEIEARIAELEAQNTAYEAYEEAIQQYQAELDTVDKFELEAKLDNLLRELENRGLLWWKRDTNVYDLHPVVRGYASNMLGDGDRVAGYDRMYNYFEGQEKPSKEEYEWTLEDLQPYIKMFKALVGGGNIVKALNFFTINTYSKLLLFISDYHLVHELLLAIFPQDETTVQISDEHQLEFNTAYMLLAVDMGNFIVDVDNLFNSSLAKFLHYFVQRDDDDALEMVLAPYAKYLLETNQVYNCYKLVEYMTVGNYVNGLGIQVKMNLEAELGYEYSQYWHNRDVHDRFILLVAPQELKLRLYHNREWEDIGNDFYDQIEKFAFASSQRDVSMIEGEFALTDKRHDDAVHHFSKSVQICNETGYMRGAIISRQVFGGLARAYLAQGNFKEAERLLSENLDDYSAALVRQALNQPEKAKEHAIAYLKWAWADGEPYVHRWHLNRARDLLQEMNVEEPKLPPFNPDNYEPFPGELELREYIKKRKEEDNK
ncbi:MAG: hypothetical protein AAFV93_14380 [Chloroflexota bacterium]